MRVNPNMIPDILSAIAKTQEAQDVALQQMSTGRRVNLPSDDPAAAAAMVQNGVRSDLVDQYTQNISSIISLMNTADASLSAVVAQVTQAISLGVEGATGTISDANRQALAQQVQGIRDMVLAQANASYRSSFVFAGTASAAAPYAADPQSASGYRYNGNGGVNSVSVGDGQEIATNIPGDRIFQHPGADLLGSLQGLIVALQNGSSTAIADATTQLRGAFDYLGQQRVFYGNTINRLAAQDTFLRQDTINIQAEQNALVGADLSKVAIAFSQAKTAHDATLAAAARVLPTSLLDYLK